MKAIAELTRSTTQQADGLLLVPHDDLGTHPSSTPECRVSDHR
jgi:hypothetical protein